MLFLLLILLMMVLSRAVWGRRISAVSVSPANPTNAAPVTVVVEGSSPAMSCRLNGTDLRRLGNALLLDMYWRDTGYGGIALAPYRHQESLGSLGIGQYTLMVRSICDGLTHETEAISFTVSDPVGSRPRIWPHMSWCSLLSPGTDNSKSLTQIQSIVIDSGSISSDISFDSGGTGQQGPRRERRVG